MENGQKGNDYERNGNVGNGHVGGHESRHMHAAGSLVRARAMDKWNVEKTRFKPANEPAEAGFSLRVLLFVLIMT